MLFPSPAELKLIEIMGGKVFRISWLKHPKTKHKFALVISIGKPLKTEKFKREVRIGKYFVDFGNDVCWAIEVDGKNFHRDVVAEFDRDSYIYSRGWRMWHIDAARLWNQPDIVQREVLRFLYV
jgi:very-short-patch-repair endonuclease